ncbi:hypothetical protein MTO96_051945 [Rhipicephalus appendiculatus]
MLTATLARQARTHILTSPASRGSDVAPRSSWYGPQGLRSPPVNAFSEISQCRRQSGRRPLLPEACPVFNLCDRRCYVLLLEMTGAYRTTKFCNSGKALQTDHHAASWNDICSPALASKLPLCFLPTDHASCGPCFC